MTRRFPAKALVIFTLLSCIATFSLILFLHQESYEAPIPLYTVGQPKISSPKASVEVVVFEDPKCNSCIIYHNQNYKKLYNAYIQTDLINYTLYLVADLPHSSIVAQTLLCAAHQSTDAFFSLLDAYYTTPPSAPTEEELSKELLRLAKLSTPSLNLSRLTSCQSSKAIKNQVVANTNYARIIMGGVIRTPMVFVNGIQLVRPSYKELTTLIEKELKKAKT